MSDMIHYNFNANHQSLGDVQQKITGIQNARDEIASLFKLLAEVYTGQGATAMHEAGRNFDSMLEDVLQNMATSQQQAQEQQDVMQALDAQNASAF